MKHKGKIAFVAGMIVGVAIVPAYELLRAKYARRLALLLGALLVTPLAAADAPTPPPQLTIRTYALAGYLFKPGHDAKYFGMRGTALYEPSKFFLGTCRVQAAKQTDGGAVDVSLTDPASFDSLEGECSVAGRPSSTFPLFLFAAAGTTLPYDKGKIVLLDSYPKTAIFGPWLRLRYDLWLLFGFGLYEPTGRGPAGVVSLQLPIKDGTYLMIDMAQSKKFELRANVGTCLLCGGK